ncbi:LysR family transcriptional regulator [uncultured Tistrella sp.]|uniref:LysR family transcriptional regulator n=1 Tax=Tistrella mobilis TaxID=171437 RepID=UPI000C0A4A33|nr:LysR family transcriptional regulator [uncultured Tistrella sp.]MAM75590.1 LysR family transcriptional regulator [Tistrella sp.]
MSQVSGLNWDDLRLVLIVAEQGTMTAAAVTLRISHPTLSRRLRQIEAGLGVRLFDRTPPRWRLTAAGEEMRDLAIRLRDDIQGLESRIRGRDDAPGGVVRLTAPDAVAEYLLPGVLASLCRELPDVTVELVVSNEVVSLAGRAADIALRVTEAPDPVLKGRRVGTVAMAVHADAELARKWTDGNPADRPWIGYDAGLACTGPGRWVAARIPESRIRFRANTLPGAAQAVRSGIGFGVLPCFIGAAIPGLVRVSEPLTGLSLGLWLLVHPEMARVPRIRSAADALARALRTLAPVLDGRSA